MLRAGIAAALVPSAELFAPYATRDAAAFVRDEFDVLPLTSKQAFARFGEELNALAHGNPDHAALEHRIRLWEIGKGWRSRVFAMHKGKALAGVILLRERMLIGVPTGYFVGGDAMGDICLLCEPSQRRYLLRWFLQWLLDKHAFALHLQSNDAHALSIRSTDLRNNCSLHVTRTSSRWRHELENTFDASIASFGKRTRRNLRYSLRAAEQNSWQFVPLLSSDEIEESISQIDQHATYPASREILAARAKLRRSLPRFFTAGVRDSNGRWLSTISGVRSQDGVTRIHWQHNAVAAGLSLCTVMRALLIRSEGANGTRCIEYLSGTNSLMEHCCREDVSIQTIFLKQGPRLKLFRLLLDLPVASPNNVLRKEMLSGTI